MSKASVFRTEITLGERYRDSQTGFEGTASAVYFFQHGCERVELKGLNKNEELVSYVFDAPELEHIDTSKPVKVIEAKTGGPHDRKPVVR